MADKRVFIERKTGFDIERKQIIKKINSLFNIDLNSLRYLIIYDLFDIDDDVYQSALKSVFSEPNKDVVSENIDYLENVIAIEYLPGQFDQRADSAMQCVRLIKPSSKVYITSGYLFMFDEKVERKKLEQIKKYFINKVESREKDLTILTKPIIKEAKKVSIFHGFIYLKEKELFDFYNNNQFAMSFEDLLFIQEYFQKEERRDPFETEIKVLDTYWSDHCRHTTFETVLKDVVFEEGKIGDLIKETFEDYLGLRKKLRIKKPVTLMDLATINSKYERKNGRLDDLEISDEINACSIFIDVLVQGKIEKWLLMFKNETHNHPTEIEPFGGASTCLGGAIRDPLSGRSFIYGAMRITGAEDITKNLEDTLPGKLPQSTISYTAAQGYSSYGNQIGLPTTFVQEIFHEGYLAKRMEVGAVIGAVKASDIIRDKPKPEDRIILIGGKTGRDGIGGATGSSKVHNSKSVEEASSEVQKGNAPEERKIQRLFRNKEVTKLIKKANDFGAGGVSVAIGELAEGIDINLDLIPVKYKGINGTELAISESQERMAVVIDPNNVECFINYCKQENLEATEIAVVTNNKRLRMFWDNQIICDLDRDFIETSGVRQTANARIVEPNVKTPFIREYSGKSLKERIYNMLKSHSIASQEGLVEMFDSSIGRTTVLFPYGGKNCKTKAFSSVQKIPVKNGETETVSIMAFGYNPVISSWSPYHGASYAIVDSIAKIVSTGGSFNNIRFSFQEYFERLKNDPKRWGKPLSSLLGAYMTLKEFSLPAIGGKDSMSGTFNDKFVPPTLISFAVTTDNIKNIISPEFKNINSYLYLFDYEYEENYLPNFKELKRNYSFIKSLIDKQIIISASPLEEGGLAEALIKSTFGNDIGINIATEKPLFDYKYGAVLVESLFKIDYDNAIYLGATTNDKLIIINDSKLSIDECLHNNESTFECIYPIRKNHEIEVSWKDRCFEKREFIRKQEKEVIVLNPVFPGTNCEYDTTSSFQKAGAKVNTFIFKNQTEEEINKSIEQFKEMIDEAHIIVFSGGFSSGDEPDGSGKFIASVLKNKLISEAVQRFLKRKNLILGICNGFQALIKSGLLPFGEIENLKSDSPTLFKNDVNHHVSAISSTRVSSLNSPWLSNFKIGDIHKIPMSHGEGKFVIDEAHYETLVRNNQIAFHYVDNNHKPTLNPRYNINGSCYAIEGIISEDGLILGKMGHSERYDEGLFKNIFGNLKQDIFKNAVDYFINGGKK